MSGSVRQLKFYVLHSKKCGAVTKNQGTEVANCGTWPAFKGGHLHRILHCVHITPVF